MYLTPSPPSLSARTPLPRQDVLRAGTKPTFLLGKDSLVWSRHYSAVEERHCECSTLTSALEKAGASRMVVGHTIQDRCVPRGEGGCSDLVLAWLSTRGSSIGGG